VNKPVLGVGVLSVPERRQRLRALLNNLGLTPDVVALDTQHMWHVYNWWRAVDIACARAIDGTQKPTHVLIIEDDAEPCPDFMTVAKKLIELYPSRTISFFSRDPTVTAAATGSLTIVHDVPTDLAVVYPVAWLLALRQDYEKHSSSFARAARRWSYGADEMRAELRPEKTVWATAPSLVEHGCPLHSTLAHFYPQNIATRFIGADVSALSIDWDSGSRQDNRRRTVQNMEGRE